MNPIMASILLALCVACVPVSKQSGVVSQEIASKDLELLLRNKEVSMIDVRSPNERLAGKISGAVELLYGPIQWTERRVSPEDIEAFLLKVRERFPNTSTRLVVFCNVGIRSQAAARVLIEHGYRGTMTVREGFLGNQFGEGVQVHLF